jgi:hypothetical protein
MPGVRRDLDAGADLAELACLLEHDRAEALARERERGREPADAAASDDDGLLVPCFHCSMLSAARPSGVAESARVSAISKWLRPAPTIAGAPSFSANSFD